ncbi:hypothetical protein POV27_08510 [Aureisphaera galaxeae]|uniref:hypothetical protein n=1 Tax=Aureisphaera galaxeae TaxID=1538023 RepID=UPI0023501C63|nr:hypothetical protein [Aureisphaera galaxeae]MDC8004093.1 hypothetical protein [Aureisphaera galaxeae]
MITIHLKPSFHKFSTIVLRDNEIVCEIRQRFQDLTEFEKKEVLTASQDLKLKELKEFNQKAKKEHWLEKSEIPKEVSEQKARINELIKNIIDKPIKDDRIILDGIQVECVLHEPEMPPQLIEFHSPEDGTREIEIIKSLFVMLNQSFTSEPVVNYLELVQGYFGMGQQWRITNEDPLTMRLFGSLSIYEKEGIIELFNSLESNKVLILDLRNLDGMGTTFHECFQELMGRMEAVYWLVSENELLLRHLDEIGVSNTYVFKDMDVILEKMKNRN